MEQRLLGTQLQIEFLRLQSFTLGNALLPLLSFSPSLSLSLRLSLLLCSISFLILRLHYFVVVAPEPDAMYNYVFAPLSICPTSCYRW